MSNLDYDGILQQQQPIHQQLAARCSFLFVQTQPLSQTCAEFGFCQEPTAWCWPETCALSLKDAVECSINGTSHFCICSSLPPPLHLENENIDYGFTTSTLSSRTINSTWLTSSGTTVSTAIPNLEMDHQNTSIDDSSSPIGGRIETDGLPVGAIAAIVVVSFLVAVALIALSVWSVLKLKRKRKLEGKYCPAVEEQKSSANTLPPLPLPAPEGLI